MIKNILMLFLLGSILFTYSCDRPMCENQNPIFDKYEMESDEYKMELWNQINAIGHDNLTYWFDEYVEQENKDYMIVHTQNDALCAKAKILVKDWGRFIGLRTKKKGYGGAELKGLRFDFEETEGLTEFVFKEMESISD